MTKNKNSLSGALMLILCAAIWGFAFVAQSDAMDSMGPLTFYTLRSILGGTVLIPVILFFDGMKKRNGTYKKPAKSEKIQTLKVGILCGSVLCVASLLQQYGMALGTNSGNAGFITALYILIVPILSFVFFKKRTSPVLWICVGLSLVGLWFICVKDNFSLNISDMAVLLSAFVFAVHITVIDKYAVNLDGVKVSMIQFYFGAIISMIAMFIFEKPDFSLVVKGWLPVLYTGVFSSGVAFTLQILGQQRTDPTLASLFMSFESVFALLGTVLISMLRGSGQIPTLRELVGCAFMFCAVIGAQLFENKKTDC